MTKNKQYTGYTFVNSEVFDKALKKFKLNDDDLRKLCFEIGGGWKNHDVVEGTGGLRKFRFSSASENRGKSGSYRVLYLLLEQDELVYLVMMYSKGSQENITDEQKAILKQRMDSIKKEVRQSRKNKK